MKHFSLCFSPGSSWGGGRGKRTICEWSCDNLVKSCLCDLLNRPSMTYGGSSGSVYAGGHYNMNAVVPGRFLCVSLQLQKRGPVLVHEYCSGSVPVLLNQFLKAERLWRFQFPVRFWLLSHPAWSKILCTSYVVWHYYGVALGMRKATYVWATFNLRTGAGWMSLSNFSPPLVHMIFVATF